MRAGRPTKGRRQTKRRRPRREVRDLLRDFGRAQRRDGSLWLTLDLGRLPAYMLALPAAQEARRWVLVLSSGGQVARYIERS